MPSRRQRRVADQIREILSELVQFEASDPRLEGVTVMDVTIDRELMVATVYINALRGEDAHDDVLAALKKAAGFFRRELGQRIRLQNTPELRFKWDDSLVQAERIEQLLAGLRSERSESPAGETDETDR